MYYRLDVKYILKVFNELLSITEIIIGHAFESYDNIKYLTGSTYREIGQIHIIKVIKAYEDF